MVGAAGGGGGGVLAGAAALPAVPRLSRPLLHELKALREPPEGIKLVLAACLLLFGDDAGNPSWTVRR